MGVSLRADFKYQLDSSTFGRLRIKFVHIVKSFVTSFTKSYYFAPCVIIVKSSYILNTYRLTIILLFFNKNVDVFLIRNQNCEIHCSKRLSCETLPDFITLCSGGV